MCQHSKTGIVIKSSVKIYIRETDKMRLKNTKVISFLLILILSLQLTGCLGITNGIPSKATDALLSLKTSIRNFQTDEFLSLLKIDKDSSVYKEYEERLDLDSYTADAAKCYKAVASGIEVKYDETSIESDSDIFKIKVTFLIPDWKDLFEDDTFSGPDGICAKLEKADKNKTELTLRLIKTKDGYKIKNHEDLMEIFDFVGYEIKALHGGSVPTIEGTTEPSESSKRTTEPSESSSEPAETKPTSGKNNNGDSIAKAYDDYAKLLQKNNDGIEWFQKNVNSNACGLVDITGDDIPDLYFFTKNAAESSHIALYIYSYDPDKQKSSMILLETLTDAESNITEFFVLRTKTGQIVSYKGYLDENGSITEYGIYSSKGTGHFMEYTGKMFLTLGPEVKGPNGDDMQIKVCTVQGVDKYTTSTKVEVEEFRRIEKDILGSSDSVFSAKFQKSFNSVPYQLMGSAKLTGLSYNDLIKKLNG